MKFFSFLNSSKLAVAILISAFVIAVAIILNSFIKSYNNSGPNGETEKIYENIGYIKTAGSPFVGNPDAKVTIVEYVDFQCPICKRVYDEIMPQLRRDYINTNKVKFVYKSLPIDDLHITAFRRTEGAYCAFDQGGSPAFFKYHDELFNRFNTISDFSIDNELMDIAVKQGLNQSAFGECLNNEKYKPVIKKDLVEAIAINANGTPTWLIGKADGDKLADTVKLNGLHEYYVYQTVLDQLLGESEK